MIPAHTRPSLPDRAAFYGLLFLLVWLPVPWGSHRPWATDLFVVLAGLLLALAGLGRAITSDPWRPQRHVYVAAALWLPWLAWIGLQLVPLGAARLAAWSPAAAALHAGAAQVPGLAPLYTLSVAPALTAQALVLSLAYFALYLLVLLTARGGARRRAVVLALVVSGLAQAVYGSLMTLSGGEYGFLVKKVFYVGFATGTFVNRDHYAAYLGLTAAAGIGLILADLGPGLAAPGWRGRLSSLIDLAFSTKLRVRLALVAMVIGIVLSRSRMGNTAFFAALGVCGLAYMLLRARRLFLRALLLFASLVLVDTLIVGQWFGLDRVVQRIEATEMQKETRVEMWQRLPPLVESYRATGSGLGSFAEVFPPYRSEDIEGYFDHAHDDYLEFLIETGAPGLALLLLLLGSHMLHAAAVLWRREDRLPQGLCFGFLMSSMALALHAIFEFNFQIPAIAASYVTLMALAASCSQQPGGRKRQALSADEREGSERADAREAV